MNRFLGLGAVVLASITAWVGLSRQAVQKSVPVAERRQSAPPAKGNATAAKNRLSDEVGCQAIEDALQTFFLIGSADVKAPDHCFAEKPNSPTSPLGTWKRADSAHYMIALLPDPIHTHMAATFDQLTEAIEHAAQEEGFAYDSFWLPWRDADQPYSSLSDNLAAIALRRTQEDQPGVLLFRNSNANNSDPYSGGLVIFVVGEQSTAGVNKVQFENAVAWLQVLDPGFASEPLSILGPTSSGSFASLEDLLSHGTLQTKTNLQIASGSASSEKEIGRFNVALGQKLIGKRVVTFAESTSLEIQRYLRLLALEGYDTANVAVVEEDETQFGYSTALSLNANQNTKSWNNQHQDRDQQPHDDVNKINGNEADKLSACRNNSSQCFPALSLNYPRDIASLRSAYQKQGLMSPQGNNAEYANRQRLLSQDLDENAEEVVDTIKTYSGGQADLSDEAELLQIVQQLQLHQTQFVLLASSNPLDQIFLARVLRATYPSARVVILASNQSMFRERGVGSLRGVLTLSPYPLSPEVQAWTTDIQLAERPVFTTHTAQGVYYATRYLIRASAADGDSESPLPGYAAPLWMDKSPNTRIPPTWLAVISAGKSWPVAALDERSLDTFEGTPSASGAPNDSRALLSSPQDLPHSTQPDLETSIQLPIEYRVAVIVCFLWMVLHIYFRSKASVIHKPRLRAYFSLTIWWQHSLVLSLSWACIGLVTISLVWCLRYAAKVSIHCVLGWVLALILVVLVCAEYPTFDWLRHRKEYPATRKAAAAALLSAAVMLSYIAVLWKWTPHWNEATSVPELWRGIHLLSGVSPAAPFVLLAIGGYLWCLQNLHGLALFNDDQPRLPSADQLELNLANSPCPNDEAPSVLDGKSIREVRKSMLRMFAADDYEISDKYEIGREWGLPLGKKVVRLFLLVLVVLLTVVRMTQLGIRDLGIQSYGTIYGLAALISIAIMLTEAYQLWHIWRSLHQLLGFLDRVPLRRTMRGIRSFSWSSVWAMGGTVLECRYEMLSRQYETMRHLVNVWQLHPPGDAGVLYDLKVQTALDEMEKEMRCKFGPWFTTLYKQQGRIDLGPAKDMQERIRSLAGALMLHVLIPAWQVERKSLIVHYGTEEEESNTPKDQGAQFLSQTQSNSPLVRAAEEFVCLNYLAFIQNIMGRIRTLITGTALLFLATAVSSSTYPFDPQPTLGLVFSLVFAALAGSVIMVYAQAHRDATLSNITNTTPGSLGGDFYIKVVQFALGPALGLVAVLFPSVANFLFTWLQLGQMK
jgi:hypothetical protein